MLTLKDACKYLGVSRATIYRLIRAGKLPANRALGKWCFEEKVLDRIRAGIPSARIVKPAMMSVNDACRYLGLSRWTIYRLVKERRLSAVKSGGRWRFAKDEVKQFLCGDRKVPHHIIGMDFEGGLMGSKETSEALGINRITLYRLVKDGRLPATKVAGVWRFIRNEVSRYLIKRRYSLGIYTARPLFFRSYVLDKYRKDSQTYYIKESAYDGFVGSRKDYYEYQTLKSMHRVREGDKFFVELHYHKVAVKGGVILALRNKQYQSLPAQEMSHWGRCLLSEKQLREVEL